MLEVILCSLITILPDYLFRRYVQGRRLGKEITFFSAIVYLTNPTSDPILRS